MPIHTVEQGEHISGITADYGFSDYHIIWDDAKNAELAKIRDPHVLFPGDEIFVPTKILKQETGATGKTHDFQVKEVPLYLCLRLRDLDEAPIKTAPYQLNLDKFGKATGKRSYTYDGEGTVGKHKTAKISFTTELSFDLDLDQGGAKVTGTLSVTQSKGTLHFDPKHGRVVSLSNEFTLAGALNVRDAAKQHLPGITLDTAGGIEIRLRGAVAGVHPCQQASVVYHQEKLTLIADRVSAGGPSDCAG